MELFITCHFESLILISIFHLFLPTYYFTNISCFQGFSSLEFDSHYSRLYASCTDDVIYAYDFIRYNQDPGMYWLLTISRYVLIINYLIGIPGKISPLVLPTVFGFEWRMSRNVQICTVLCEFYYTFLWPFLPFYHALNFSDMWSNTWPWPLTTKKKLPISLWVLLFVTSDLSSESNGNYPFFSEYIQRS